MTYLSVPPSKCSQVYGVVKESHQSSELVFGDGENSPSAGAAGLGLELS